MDRRGEVTGADKGLAEVSKQLSTALDEGMASVKASGPLVFQTRPWTHYRTEHLIALGEVLKVEVKINLQQGWWKRYNHLTYTGEARAVYAWFRDYVIPYLD